jgi:hypothetical protein
MIEGFEQARLEVQHTVASDIDWFTSPEERHFDVVGFIVPIATVLVTAFLAGFTEEAKKSAREIGHKAFRKLEEFLGEYLKTGDAPPQDVELQQLAEEAPTLAKQKSTDFVLYMDRTEENLRIYLQTRLPPEKAIAMATHVRQAVAGHVLRA